MANGVVSAEGGASALPTLLGRGPVRIPTGGKIRPGIMVLTRKAAELPEAKAIYERGVAEGLSFEQIEQALAEALPNLKSPLAPRNVPWFTVRPKDFANPEIARQILEAYGEDRGKGARLYRFPVVFPSDHWQSVMPHELATWTAHEKRFWSQYSPDGLVRYCMRHSPVPVDHTGRRSIRIFGGRKAVQREENGGICDPESCREYQERQCNLTGRLLFFIPGIRSISAFELPTTSFYAMSNAIRCFLAVGHMRGGRISGFLGRERTTFFVTKTLKEVAHIDEQGRAVRVPQWIIELEAPVDVTALLRDYEDQETVVAQAQLASQVLEGQSRLQDTEATAEPMHPGQPTLDRVRTKARTYGIDPDRYMAYADSRWGPGWKLNLHGRSRAWDELDRYKNDPQGYLDKIDSELCLAQAAKG